MPAIFGNHMVLQQEMKVPVWGWAEAKIEGDEVVISSARVATPVAVRYGWNNNPECNLYNKAGLPASPFRTDDWN
jgi:sialate O-acetylesterase